MLDLRPLFQPSGHRPVYIQHRATVHVGDRRKKPDTFYLKLETARRAHAKWHVHVVLFCRQVSSARHSFQSHSNNYTMGMLARSLAAFFIIILHFATVYLKNFFLIQLHFANKTKEKDN